MYWNSGDAELCETELSPIEFRKRFPKVRRLTIEEVHSTRRRTHHDQKLRCFRIRQDSCNGVEFRYTRTRVIGVKVRLPASDDSIVSRVSRVIAGSLSLLHSISLSRRSTRPRTCYRRITEAWFCTIGVYEQELMSSLPNWQFMVLQTTVVVNTTVRNMWCSFFCSVLVAVLGTVTHSLLRFSP